MKETKDSIIKNANEKMNEFINKMRNEYDFDEIRNNDGTIIEFNGTDTITVDWWGGFATSRFLLNGYNNFSTSDGYGLDTVDLNTIADFHNEYLHTIMYMLNWYAAEMARAESTAEVDAAGGFYLNN